MGQRVHRAASRSAFTVPPSVGKGPVQRDGVSDHYRKYRYLPSAFLRRISRRLDYPIDAAGCACGSVATVNNAHRLSAGDVVVAERSAHRRGHGPRARLAHPAHRHAQVLRLDDHHHPTWFQRVHQGVGYLAGHPLLHLRAPRIDIDQPGQLGKPGDLALVVRDIADVRDPDEREQVMFARPVHLDVADDDHLVMVRVEHGAEHVLRALPQPGELLRVGPRDPGRGVAQAVALRVLADGEEDLPDRALDARQVELAAAAFGGPGTRRHSWLLGTSSCGWPWPPGVKPKAWPLDGSAAVPLPAVLPLPLPSAAASASSLGDRIGGRS